MSSPVGGMLGPADLTLRPRLAAPAVYALWRPPRTAIIDRPSSATPGGVFAFTRATPRRIRTLASFFESAGRRIGLAHCIVGYELQRLSHRPSGERSCACKMASMLRDGGRWRRGRGRFCTAEDGSREVRTGVPSFGNGVPSPPGSRGAHLGLQRPNLRLR